MLRVSTFLRLRLLVANLALAGLLAGCSGPAANRMVSSANETVLSDASRDLDEPSKLSPALQRLADVSETPRDIGTPDSSAPNPAEVGSPVPGTRDLYQVVIHVTPEIDMKALAAAGAFVQARMGNIIYATVHAKDLPAVAEVDGIIDIDPVPGGRLPAPPRGGISTGGGARGLESGTADSLKFDHHGLTGKGVIVAVIDTGIDWKHPDFINPDGTSRIKFLWDVFDDTWEKSGHKVGSAPPRDWEPGKPMGTLYTNEQITAALKGHLKISRPDTEGHGTACAGTAVGNGLGVAPDAELIFVSTHDDNGPEGNDGSGTPVEVAWIKQIAAEQHKSCVISLSFGGGMNPHDGTGAWPEAVDQVLDHGNAPGLAICVSAGNDGTHSMHARGRFGPAIENELSGGMSAPIELHVTEETVMFAYFDSKDDWGMLIEGSEKFMVGKNDKPGYIKLSKKSLALKSHGDLVLTGSDNLTSEDRAKVKDLYNKKGIDAAALNDKTDEVGITLPPGTYMVSGGGHSKQVTHGVFDLYLPEATNASFGQGGDHKMVIGSPGDAQSVITVAAYDCCNTWDNVSGSSTYSGQVNLGNISSFSSAGFRRDGVIKPDIAAPGDFVISTFAEGSKLAEGDPTITKDGKHVAWRGTSASCPYTAGVVALMLQKNAQLTCNQAKQYLRDTAEHDLAVTGAVPNGEWGYGKLDPEKALAAVPAGVAVAPTTEPAPVVTPTPAPTVAANFVGTFKNDDMTITLAAADDGFTGQMIRGGKNFPVTAKAKDAHLDGTATSNGHDFSFTGELNGDTLTVTAGDKTFALTRQGAENPFANHH